MIEENKKEIRQVKIKIVCLETGEIKVFEGIYTIKRVFNILINYEKNEKFKILSVEFDNSSNSMFDNMSDARGK